MLRKMLLLTIIATLCSTSLALAGDKIRFEYVIEVDESGKWVKARETDGFSSGQRITLRVKASRDCYIYVAATRWGGDYQLVWPIKSEKAGDNWLRKNKEYRIPAEGALKLDNEPGVERLVVIVSEQRVPELENVFLQSGELTEEIIIGVRDRYSPTYFFQKEIKNDKVIIYGRTSDKRPTVLIEEIIFRHAN